MDNKKIKIALMSYAMDNRPNKGTAVYTRKIIENLLGDKRFELYLVHFEKVNDPLYDRAHEIIMPNFKLPKGNHFFSQLLFFWRYRKKGFDIIHWFQARLYPFYWLAPAKKIIVTMHGAGEYTAPRKRFYYNEIFKFVLTYLNRWVDAAIVGSKHAKDEIAKYYKIKRQKIFVTYNGGGEIYRPLEKQAARRLTASRYNADWPFILDVARLTPHKNINSLIKAYIIYRDEYKRGEKLVIVGSPMLDYQNTYDLVKKSPYQDDIRFINFIRQEDLNAIYSAAEVFVFPSLDEGFGLPIVEAMASGTPVITSNVSSLPEVAGEAAILINPLDIKEMAYAMNRVLTDENLKNELIKKGLERSRKFSWAETVRQTKEIYFKLFESIK